MTTTLNGIDNFYIEGFDSHNECFREANIIGQYIYAGKTSEIPEEVLERVLQLHPNSDLYNPMWFDYSDPTCDLSKRSNPHRTDYERTMRKSINTACSKEYCIIFHNKQ